MDRPKIKTVKECPKNSKPYTPSIANVYYLAGLIESWGRGIKKICQACCKDGSPLPEYTVHPGDIMIKFTAAEGRVVYGPSNKGTVNGIETDDPVLRLLYEAPAYTYQGIADKLKIGRKAVFGRIRNLKEAGIIERFGSDKKGYWKINE